MTVLSYEPDIMNLRTLVNRAQRRQPMRRQFVLRNDWLKYSHGIASYAYDETNGTCVYHQLEQFLLDPPTGNPTKFIAKRRTSQEALVCFFQSYIQEHNLQEHYPHFDLNSGVTSELIGALCKEIKRNMYAYDDKEKVFDCVTEHSSKNYCPIIFYKLHGHCYLINDREVM